MRLLHDGHLLTSSMCPTRQLLQTNKKQYNFIFKNFTLSTALIDQPWFCSNTAVLTVLHTKMFTGQKWIKHWQRFALVHIIMVSVVFHCYDPESQIMYYSSTPLYTYTCVNILWLLLHQLDNHCTTCRLYVHSGSSQVTWYVSDEIQHRNGSISFK